MPVGFDPRRVHHQRERREQFGDASTIEGRTDMGDAHGADEIGLRNYTLNRSSADERFILFERVKPKSRSLDGRARHGHRKSLTVPVAAKQPRQILRNFIDGRSRGSAVLPDAFQFFLPVVSRKAPGSCLRPAGRILNQMDVHSSPGVG